MADSFPFNYPQSFNNKVKTLSESYKEEICQTICNSGISKRTKDHPLV